MTASAANSARAGVAFGRHLDPAKDLYDDAERAHELNRGCWSGNVMAVDVRAFFAKLTTHG